MILGITGHRPPKIGGYTIPNPIYNYVCQQLEKYFKELKPDKIISGFCIGTDLYAANIGIKLNIPVLAAIPFIGQELKWNDIDQKRYNFLLSKVSEKVIVSPGGYSPEKMQIRNQYIVDNCDLLLAVWDGTSGGTKNCINYAKSLNKQIIIIDPNEKRFNN